MTSKTINIDYPPGGNQVTVGAGTLTRIAAALPQISPVRADGTDRIAYPVNATVYDSATGKLDLSTPLLTVNGTQDAGALNISYSKGLYVTQNTASSLVVTYQ